MTHPAVTVLAEYLLETRITRLTWATIASTALLVGFIIKGILA